MSQCQKNFKANLIALSSEQSIPSKIEINKENFTIGKLSKNDCCISLPHVSSSHALIQFDSAKNAFVLTDLNSTNGTYLRGEKLVPNTINVIHHKDIVIFGKISMQFLYEIPAPPTGCSAPLSKGLGINKNIQPGLIIRGSGENVYRMESLFNQGGMGTLYKATSLNDQQLVVVKFLPSEDATDKKNIFRFLTEASTVVELEHENIVKGLDLHHDMEYCFMVMEYIPGKNVDEALQRYKRLPVKIATEIALQVTRALVYLEEKNIFHRDIKPGNIICTAQKIVKLVDFGLIKVDNIHLTNPEYVLGTPYYMAPEQLDPQKTIDIRADIYALGTTYYHMLTGIIPFFDPNDSNIQSYFMKKLRNMPIRANQVNHALSEEIAILVENMMHPNKNLRIPSPKNIIPKLEKILKDYSQDQSDLTIML